MLNFFIERPVLSTVIALLMILSGALAAFGLPIAQYPQVVPPQVTVNATFPGANANVVSESVAASIEQQVNGAQDMLYMSSKSGNDGTYSLTVTFEIGSDKNIDQIEVQNRVAIAQPQLPAEVIRNGITVRKATSDFLQVITLISPERRYDTVFLSNYALLNLFDALARVKGVGQVRIFGARDYSMRIWLDAEKMGRLGVTATDVSNIVREQNVVAPAGSVGVPPVPQGQQMQYTVFVKGRLAETGEFENIVIREAGNGQVVRLKDVARIELGAADYSISVANDDHPAVALGIFLQPDANALDTAKAIHEVMEEQSAHFPPGMNYRVPYTTTPFVKESLKEVVKTLFIVFLLVAIVAFLFLQSWRATLIPILAVPISLVGSFAAFSALGFSINTLTLFGMVLAIGIVVDDAIVVVEAVQHRLDQGGATPLQATKAAMADVGGPVVAIALVLAAVFVPVEDRGFVVGVATLPAAAWIERTNAALAHLSGIAREAPAVEEVIYLSGYNLLTGQVTSYNGTAFIRFKPFEERKAAAHSVTSINRTLVARLNGEIKDANVLVLNLPPIRGLSTSGGFTFVLQNRTRSETAELSKVLQDVLGPAPQKKEIRK